jgi:uncharacterized protein YggT (Ycf19 family)
LRVLRLVEVIVDPALVFFREEINLLLRGVDLRPKLFELVFLVFEAQFDVVLRSSQIGIAGSTEKLVDKDAAIETFA